VLILFILILFSKNTAESSVSEFSEETRKKFLSVELLKELARAYLIG